MRQVLLGYAKVDFTPEGGDKIKGTKVFVAGLGNEKMSQFGMIPNKKAVFVRYDEMEIIAIDLDAFIGKEVEVDYNANGKAVAISALVD